MPPKNKIIFSTDKINLIYSYCLVPEWVIMYTFHLLERETFSNEYKHIYETYNINPINITNFCDILIEYNKINIDDSSHILEYCYKNLITYLDNITPSKYQIILYCINDHSYNIFNQKNKYLEKLKEYNIKIVFWRDDIFRFSPYELTSPETYMKEFKNNLLEKIDLLLTPSIKYFENINSRYLNKTKFYPYSINNNITNNFIIKPGKKINKILISGEYFNKNKFIYEKRRLLVENMKPTLFEYIKRPKNFTNNSNYKTPSYGMTGYYQKLSEYKGVLMTLATYPLDFVLGKFIEAFNTNSLVYLDYSPELDSRFYIEAFEDYIPLITKNNQVIQEKEYFTMFNDVNFYNNIVTNGITKMRKYFGLERNIHKLCVLVRNIFEKKQEKNFDYLENILIDIDFCEFNFIIGKFVKITNKINSKINIYVKDNKIKYILELVFYNKNINIYLDENIPKDTYLLSNILDTRLSLYTDEYIIYNFIDSFTYLDNIIGDNKNKYYISIITDGTNEEFINKLSNYLYNYTNRKLYILNINNHINLEDYSISDSFKEDIQVLNKSKLTIYFKEEYSYFLKNCGVPNLLLFNNLENKEKNLVTRVYNPFSSNELNIKYIGEYDFEANQLCKLVYMIKQIYEVESTFYDMYLELQKIFNLVNLNPVYEKFHYFGEFGFFNVTILGALDKYFKNNNTKIIVNAHKNFTRILEILFPNNVITQPIEKLEKNREYHKTEGIKEPLDSYDLAEHLGIDKSLIKNIKYISNPINYSSDFLNEKYKDRKYIVIFPRYREGNFSHRNMELEVFYNIVSIIDNLNYEIICVGHREEVIDQVKKKFTYIDNLEETIYLLNNTKLFISPDSGFIDFAKNCGTKNVIMVYNNSHINYHFIFSPFKTNFKSIDVTKKRYISELEKEINYFLI
jgi:hypothetical protein